MLAPPQDEGTLAKKKGESPNLSAQGALPLIVWSSPKTKEDGAERFRFRAAPSYGKLVAQRVEVCQVPGQLFSLTR